MRGRALLVATSQYRDESLSTLVSTHIDARELQEVLADPLIGGMKVAQCIDGTCQVWREHIHDFFADATRDELLLLYVTGHAIKDRDGKLYFAAADTRTRSLLATGIPASFVQDSANESPSSRIVMILDTCYSGAFAKGLVLKSKPMVNTGEYFREGTGKIVITASDAIQYALAGAPVDGQPTPSAFTKHVIEGLRSGRADLNDDGIVTSEELCEYVSAALHNERAGQKPERWGFGVKRDLIIALNPHAKTPALPQEIQELLADPRPKVRALAVDELWKMVRSENPFHVRAAEAALKRMQKDESNPNVEPSPERASTANDNQPPQSELQRSAYRRSRLYRPPSAFVTQKGLDVRNRIRVTETWYQPDRWNGGSRFRSRGWVVAIVLAGLGLLGFAVDFQELLNNPNLEDIVSSPPSEPVPPVTAVVPSAGTTNEAPRPVNPHLVAGTKPNSWSTESGYRWLNDEPSDLRVVWTPGTPHKQHAHVVAGNTEGNWTPAEGYTWASATAADLSVRWLPGRKHSKLEHIIAGTEEGKFTVEPGYTWANPQDPSDFTVRAQ